MKSDNNIDAGRLPQHHHLIRTYLPETLKEEELERAAQRMKDFVYGLLLPSLAGYIVGVLLRCKLIALFISNKITY